MKYKVRYRDLSVTSINQKKELLDSIDKVLTHGKLLIGPEVEIFENNVSQYVGNKYCVGLSSGTDAIYLALKALNVGHGDEVITTPLSWIATLNAIELTGAKAVFADIDDDLNISPKEIKKKITKDTKIILPVHFTGRLCKMGEILEIADNSEIQIIEDAAQSFGAHLNNRMAGTFGKIGCYSMNTMKMYNSYGEAGAVVLNDRDIYNKIISLRYNGTVNKEDCVVPSTNARIDTIQAAMMNVNLKYLNNKIKNFRKNSLFYNESLKNIVNCPVEDNTYHTYYTYTIVTERRNELFKYLQNKGVECKIYHPILMPFHTAYRKRYNNLNIPKARKLVKEIISLPNHDLLTEEECNYVVDTIKNFYK